jgi:NADH-quinone oxidoreductase subunit E
VAVAKPVAATLAVAKPAPVVKPAAVKPVAAKPAPAKPVVPAIDPESMFDDALVGKTMPPLLSAPEGKADDLTRIKGVGPKINQLLQELGVHHYRQIAAWTPGEIAWINSKLDFKGRVQREKWVAQARAMMKGG